METPSETDSICDQRSPSPELLETTEPAHYHFKVMYDPSWDYDAICQKIYDKDKPYLAVLEHLSTNAHVHFHGTSNYAARTVKNYVSSLAKKHHLRKLDPKCRPAKMSSKETNEMGFQYIAKEVNISYIKARNLFTDEEIHELKKKSQEYVHKLKFNTTEIVKQIFEQYAKRLPHPRDGDFDKLMQKFLDNVKLSVYEARKAAGLKIQRRFFTDDVLNAILEQPHCLACHKTYILRLF